MADFKVIETQEQLDAIIGERLSRAQSVFEKKYADYISPDDFKAQTEGFNAQIAELNKAIEEEKAKSVPLTEQIESLTKQVKKYETDSVKTRITAEYGLPYEFANRLTGESEDEIRKDAESLKGLVGKVAQPLPLKSYDDAPVDSKVAAFNSMLQELRNGE